MAKTSFKRRPKIYNKGSVWITGGTEAYGCELPRGEDGKNNYGGYVKLSSSTPGLIKFARLDSEDYDKFYLEDHVPKVQIAVPEKVPVKTEAKSEERIPKEKIPEKPIHKKESPAKETLESKLIVDQIADALWIVFEEDRGWDPGLYEVFKENLPKYRDLERAGKIDERKLQHWRDTRDYFRSRKMKNVFQYRMKPKDFLVLLEEGGQELFK